MARMKYSAAIAKKICVEIAQGKSLASIVKMKSMPSMSAVYDWLNQHEEFAEWYARAREDQADTLADQITDIADSEADPNRARVRIDARKWVASKLKAKKYGDRQTHQHEGTVSFTVETGVPQVE